MNRVERICKLYMVYRSIYDGILIQMAKVRNDDGVTVKQLGQMCFILIVILLALPKFLSTGVGEEVVEVKVCAWQ